MHAGNNVDDGVTVGGYVLAGGVILIVLIAVAITVTVLLMYKKKNNQKVSLPSTVKFLLFQCSICIHVLKI